MPLLAGIPHAVTWKIELPQNRTTRWILQSVEGHRTRLAQLELPPFPLYLQMLDFLTSVKICNLIDFSDVFSLKPGPRHGYRLIPLCLKKPLTEDMHRDFFVKTCCLISYNLLTETAWNQRTSSDSGAFSNQNILKTSVAGALFEDAVFVQHDLYISITPATVLANSFSILLLSGAVF